jgi:hypothetical protein
MLFENVPSNGFHADNQSADKREPLYEEDSVQL